MSKSVRDLLNSYEFTCNLPSDGSEVKFKPITTGQMKKLLVYENNDDPFIVEDILDNIITECVLTEDFNIDDLLLQDRFFLLLKIREKTKGSMYNFNYVCGKCEKENVSSINLQDMPVKDYKIDDKAIALSERLSVKLGFITRGEQKEIYKAVKSIPNITDSQLYLEVATYTYAYAMKEFVCDDDITVSLEDKLYILNENITDERYEEIKEWFDKNNFGIDFKETLTCKFCKNKEEIMIPLTSFFD